MLMNYARELRVLINFARLLCAAVSRYLLKVEIISVNEQNQRF